MDRNGISMLQEVLEPAWVDAFEAVFARCTVHAGDTVALLSESQSGPVLVELARLAAASAPSPCASRTTTSRLSTVELDGVAVVAAGKVMT